MSGPASSVGSRTVLVRTWWQVAIFTALVGVAPLLLLAHFARPSSTRPDLSP
jgi:hypothetical protein